MHIPRLPVCRNTPFGSLPKGLARALKTLVLALLVVPVLAGPAEVRAQQQIEGIAAVVNDEVISHSDLVSRLRLALMSSGLQPSEENQQRLLPQVLRGLIDEKLQTQEARRLGVSVTEEQIENAFSTIAAQNNLSADQLRELLTRNGIPIRTLTEQVSAQIAWGQVVQRQLLPRTNIGEEEVDEALSRLEANRGRPEYLLAEIFLAVDQSAQDAEVRRLAESLVQQIRQGVPFPAIARQFSQAAGAANGGDLSWVVEGQLDPVLDQALRSLSPGQVSDPIRSLSGYHILLVRDQRRALISEGGGPIVTLNQLGLPLPPNADDATRRELVARLREATANLQGCEALVQQAAAIGAVGNTDIGTGPMNRLPPVLQAVIRDLPVGQPSEPQVLTDGVAVYMVCERQDPATASPRREDIAESLRLQRLDLLQRRYLRDLRNAAFIDVRV